jgi:hypothetical protein
MKRNLVLPFAIIFLILKLQAQTEPSAGTWKTWFITSGKDYRLAAPSSYKDEIAKVLSARETWIRRVSRESNTGTRARRVTIGKI